MLSSPASALDLKRLTFGFGVGPNVNYKRSEHLGLAPSPDTTIHALVPRRFGGPGIWLGGRSIQVHLGYGLSNRLNLNFSAIGNLHSYPSYTSTAPGPHMNLLHVMANLDRRLGRPPGRLFTTGGIGYGFDPDNGGRPDGPAVSGGIGAHLGKVFDARLVATWVFHMRDPDLTDYRGERRMVALLIGLARH
jgi:hypothetical protein